MTTSADALRVVLADDEALVRAGLRMLIDGEPDMQVVGEAGDTAAVVAVVGRTRPDVVLMDVRMPGGGGIEATRRLAAQSPQVRVIVLTTFDEDAAIDGALRLGAAGFLLKTSPPEMLLDAIRRVAAGGGQLDPMVVPRVIAGYAAAPRMGERAPELDRLTPRETEVLQLVARGHNNAEIAALLHLGETTVKTHLGRVLDKLGLRDRNKAIAFAYDSGLVTPDAGGPPRRR
ncbi:response regulator transcription factor [Nakamurella multipartita]|uniref:Two component transcriptional regulator, LuxR family n=1 Tax=Nakamurella multipartita (strain ATCC 700099 / DSM 44233 / CIP 104796 / JCM 9543 / NBRC 105858 / Y-104) TaxID=479431 RepID=C8X772_NAKMY|nr:response regulator transcription factor [Nakamurella multipartita]ACV76941.1 two component transcriptional regulator, LuxR family [Nakamurella multipartita DSM 44233]